MRKPSSFLDLDYFLISISEVFVADNGGGLFALDLRNGKIAYGYKGLATFDIYMEPFSREYQL